MDERPLTDNSSVDPNVAQTAHAEADKELKPPVVEGKKSETLLRGTMDGTLLRCRKCGSLYSPGVNRCPTCNTAIELLPEPPLRPDTRDLTGKLAEIAHKRLSLTGDLPLELSTLIFQIDKETLVVPFEKAVIVGRMHGWDGQYPLVDLSPFGAYEKGVSRRHLRIKRKGSLIYVADIGSANGTWLNGRRLLPEADRLLRQGDALKLSLLELTVRYQDNVKMPKESLSSGSNV